MKRMRAFFAILLLLGALPIWRYMDLISWLWASKALYAVVFFLWGCCFLVVPAWLLRPKRTPLILLSLVVPATLTCYRLGPLSTMATNDPEHGHCGSFTYTGVFYPVMGLLTQAYADDLEARNQMCWVKKLIRKVPAHFTDKAELDMYLKLTQDKLFRPQNKFRVALPMVALLYGVILANYDERDPSDAIKSGKLFLENLKFWIDQYTLEISGRDYSWWDFPHGAYVQFEYGLIERNWESIINSVVIQEEN